MTRFFDYATEIGHFALTMKLKRYIKVKLKPNIKMLTFITSGDSNIGAHAVILCL